MLSFALLILNAIFRNQWTRLVAIGVLAFGTGWVKGWFAYPRPDIPAIQRSAADARDNYWQAKIRDVETQAQKAVDAAIEAGNHAAVPADTDLVQLCARSAACRQRR